MTRNILPSLIILGSFFINPAYAHEAHCKDSTIGDHMSDMKTSMQLMAKSLKNDDFKSIIDEANKVIAWAEDSKNYKPLKLSDTPKVKHNSFLKSYKAEMDTLLTSLNLLSQAATEQDSDTLRKLMSDIDKHSKKSHKQFRLECKK